MRDEDQAAAGEQLEDEQLAGEPAGEDELQELELEDDQAGGELCAYPCNCRGRHTPKTRKR